jgi:hypothetical protein
LQRLDSASRFNRSVANYKGLQDRASDTGNENANYVNKLHDFSNWADQTIQDQGHPYMDKDELLGHYTRITGDDGPVY